MSDEALCVALYDFHASETDELSFEKDDVLEVIEKQEDDWWLVRRNNEMGLIPSNYVYTAVSSPKEKAREKPIMKTQSVNEAAAKHQSKISKIPKLSNKQGYSQGHLSRNNVDKSTPGVNYSHGNVSNSADLLRLKELREEAEIKIDRLRVAVTNQEKGSRNSHDSDESIMEKLNELLVANSSNSDETDLIRDMRSVLQKHLSSWSGQTDAIKNAPQLQVKQPVKNPVKPVPNELRQRNIVSNSYSVPQVVNPGVDGGSSVASHGSLSSQDKLPNINNSPTYSTPGQHNIPKKKQLLSPLQQSTVVEGIRYPQCRSLVYKPSESPDNDSILSSQPPTSKLSLKYIHGYDGDIGRHGGTIRGKNIMFVNANRIVFPAAALVVVMDINNSNNNSGARHSQGFFSGHNEDVTCVTIHPERAVCASGQMGKDGRICVWDQSHIQPGYREYQSMVELYMSGGVRGVCGLNFSGDGAFLVALGIDESHTIVIFDWTNGSAVASARVGHSEVYQMGFNPYLYIGVDKFVDAIGSPHKLSYDDQQPAGCYTLVTCGGRQIKFWTFKKYLERNDQLTIDAAGFRGRQMPKSKYNWVSKYVLEGTNGIFPKSHHPHPAHNNSGHSPDHPDITCFVSVCDDDDDSGTSMPKSRIFTGTSTGAIYIWSFVIEQNPNGLLDGLVSWQPKGRLLSVITDVHDTAICDLDYTGRWNPFEYEDDDDDDNNLIKKVSPRTNKLWSERIISCSKDGIINVWKVDRCNNLQSLPFEHISGVNISTTDITTSNPRSIHWDLSGTVAVVGTTANSIVLLTGDGLVTNSSLNNTDTKNGSIQIDTVLRSNAGKVRRVASHPFYNVFLTVSSDKTVRLWDGSTHSQISCYKFNEKISCGAFSPDGKVIAVGNEAGELMVVECALLLQGSVISPGDGLGVDHWRVIIKKNVAAKTGKIPIPVDAKGSALPGDESPRGVKDPRKPNNRKVIEKTHEVLELKYSPNGEILAVGCRDNLIHLLMVSNNYKRQAVCRGHSSHIKNIDFSADSSVIQSTDVVRELLFWNTATGKQINNAYAVRNVQWFTWTNIYGWPVQGVFNGTKGVVQEGEINAVCRSHNSNLLVAGASNTVDCCVKLYRYPCLENAMPYVFGGHTSPVLDVIFLPDDNAVVSVGGNDATIFEWDIENV